MDKEQQREIYRRLSNLDAQHSIKMCHMILTSACAGFMTDEEIETYRHDLMLKPEQAKRLIQCLRDQEDNPHMLTDIDRYAWHMETLTMLGWFTTDNVLATPSIEQIRVMLERYETLPYLIANREPQHSHNMIRAIASRHHIGFILHEDDLSESADLLNDHYGLDVSARYFSHNDWPERTWWEVIEQQCHKKPESLQDICELLQSFGWLEGQAEYKQDDFGGASSYQEYAAKLCNILANVGFIPIYDDSVGYSILMLASLVQEKP